ncbi:acyltransferase family protein [Catellatospora coxensis]
MRTELTPSLAKSLQEPRPRALWADTAKGACIVLVVLWHVVMKDYLQVDWHIGIPLPGAWGTLGEQLLPLRMPLFFTISGVFATTALARPWRQTARSRIAKFLYLYTAWLLIHTAILSATPASPPPAPTPPSHCWHSSPSHRRTSGTCTPSPSTSSSPKPCTGCPAPRCSPPRPPCRRSPRRACSLLPATAAACTRTSSSSSPASTCARTSNAGPTPRPPAASPAPSSPTRER